MLPVARTLLSIFLISLITACGGGGGGSDSTDNSNNTNTGTNTSVSTVTVVDASKTPISGATVNLSGVVAGAPSAKGKLGAQAAQQFVTDSNGQFSVTGGIAPGFYALNVAKGGVNSNLNLNVGPSNASGSAKVITPLSNDGTDTWSDVSDTAVIATLSGVVTSSSGPISGAVVAISAGTASNGAVATSTTDSNGAYSLLINANKSLAGALLNATITISASGYTTHTASGFQVQNGQITTGLNWLLVATTTSATTLFRETFETDSTTAASWQATQIYGDNNNNIWHIHSSGAGITNQAVTNGFVTLPPDDISGGQVPNPGQGTRAYWYGSAAVDASGSTQGNFMGVQDPLDLVLSGGTSDFNQVDAGEQAGTLTSPSIDLTGVSLNTDIALRFNTWWEIEAVNPNSGGFDLMEVQVSNDGTNWTPLARLNPLSDPQDTANRDPLAFSNTGYNSAAAWIEQDPISLNDYRGQNIQLRFVFDTVDQLFNGFRGWMIDDVRIVEEAGTFPLLTTFSCLSPIADLPNTLCVEYGSAQFYDWFYVAYDPNSGDMQLSPLPWDPVTYASVPLTSGQQTTFTATLEYESALDGTFAFQFHEYSYTTGDSTAVGSSFGTTAYTAGTFSTTYPTQQISGAATIPTITAG
ncbi:carboxypeptidase regulatory-like domain-containing protein, partial [Sedimenticola sp.]|uniref:carboxypeptidase-like regulatory domain-containing protein n=1 Tax=Sedimenticola sp. TaxID=1940285 RepID=UPI003D0B7DCD